MKSISEYLEEDYKKWGNNPYISFYKDGTYLSKSFCTVIDDVRNMAKELLRQGYQGKNIMIYSENSYEWMVLYLGIMGYVGTCIPVDKEWTEYDMSHALSAIDTAVVFYSKGKKERIRKLQEVYPKVVYLCIEEVFFEMTKQGAKISGIPTGQLDMEQTVMILFTSGTTNIPKAIPLTQSNLFHNWNTLFQRTPMTEKDVSYLFLPLNHVYSGVANFLYSIVSGMQIYLCHDLSNMVEEMMLVRPTVVCMVPLILKRIYTVITEEILDMLRGIRFLYCGGSFTEMELKQYFLKNGVRLLEAYGTTETSSVIALDILGDENIESNGVIFENLDVKILNPDAEGVGEIIVKGGSVSKGYISRNDNYSEFDENGYYHTGDLGRIDESRHLYLKGRKRRMMVTANGKNVYLDEIEKLLLENPKIEKVKAYEEQYHVAAEIIGHLTLEEAQLYVNEINEKLPSFKEIRNIYVRKDVLGGRIK